MKSYSAAILHGLANDYPRADLLEFQFNTGTRYYTLHNHDLDWEGNTYEANFVVSAIPEIKFTKDLKVVTVDIELSGLDNVIGTILAAQQRNRKVIVTTVILDPLDNTVIGQLLKSFYLIDNHGQEASNEQNQFSLTLTNFMSDFQTECGIRSTQASHAAYWPGSTAFKNSKDVTKEITWGSA